MQTVDTLWTYTPLDRVRLDFDWAAFSHQEDGTDKVNGVGTIQIGGKVELKKEDYHKAAPGVALQYEAELPTASREALQGKGQQAILLFNHHFGKDGDVDVMVNGSVVQGCGTGPGVQLRRPAIRSGKLPRDEGDAAVCRGVCAERIAEQYAARDVCVWWVLPPVRECICGRWRSEVWGERPIGELWYDGGSCVWKEDTGRRWGQRKGTVD